jgi:hypothetical protein
MGLLEGLEVQLCCYHEVFAPWTLLKEASIPEVRRAARVTGGSVQGNLHRGLLSR